MALNNNSPNLLATTNDSTDPSHLTVNFIADPSVIAQWGTDWQTTAFGQALNDAASVFENNISDPITIDLNVGWGEVNGQSLGATDLGSSFSFGNNFLSYSQLRQALLSDTTSPVYASAYATLPATDPISGTHAYRINDAEEKALGLMSGNTVTPGGDGAVGFSSTASFDYSTSNAAVPSNQYDFVGVAEHEISEAMGRISLLGHPYVINGATTDAYSILDLFRYSSPGTLQEAAYQPAYFSVNNGTTNLDNFNTNTLGDPGDWAPSAGNDAFDAFANPGVTNSFSTTDMLVMDALGYDVTSESTISTSTAVSSPIVLAPGETLDITPSGTIDSTGTLSALYAGPSAADVVVTNQGSIALTNQDISSVTFSSTIGIGVDFEGGGSVSNAAGASIVGYNAGIVISGAPGTVSNAGSIGATGISDWGVDLTAGGSVSNAAGGTISGALVGVYIGGAAGTVSNATGASINGGGIAVHIHDANGSVTNDGNIYANGYKAIGVEFDDGGDIITHRSRIKATFWLTFGSF